MMLAVPSSQPPHIASTLAGIKSKIMTTQEILSELEKYGNEQTKRTYIKHGATEPLFGVKVQDLKKILKKTKKNHELSLELYATGNYDAMYLAGLMADEKQITAYSGDSDPPIPGEADPPLARMRSCQI